jgi:excisionase family DNA binding protein
LSPAGQNALKSSLLTPIATIAEGTLCGPQPESEWGGALAGEREAKGREGVRLLDVREAARFLGTTPASMYSMVWRREVPFVKLGRSLRIDVKDLDELIEASKVKPEGLNDSGRSG